MKQHLHVLSFGKRMCQPINNITFNLHAKESNELNNSKQVTLASMIETEDIKWTGSFNQRHTITHRGSYDPHSGRKLIGSYCLDVTN